MKKQSFTFSNSSTDLYFSANISHLKEIIDLKNSIFITDENVYNAHSKKFKKNKVIILKPGEAYKNQATVDSIVQQLLEMEADRKTFLVGVGGGVITDITGYVASIYMRGIKFGFVPTTLLALVDASIGGKNGIDVGVYKNIVGITRQPSFILQDLNFLKTLPEAEWKNGFAEIIKHACIKDLAMFKQLQQHSLLFYMSHKKETDLLIQRNARIKIKVVQQDEFEQGERKLLNLGHTLGHALENQYKLMHGQAVALGMTYASQIAAELTGFRKSADIVQTLELYGLPTCMKFDKEKVFDVLKMDKKRERKDINFILLERIGKGLIISIPLDELQQIINSLL
jgi:3-dehydroquinate synthase